MSRAREQRRQARMALHTDRAVPAFYIPVQGATPVPCTVRVHTKDANAVGALPGFQGHVTVVEFEPRVIFLVEDVPAPRPKGVVSVEPGEAYQIEAVDPVDGITITAKVSRVSADRAADLPVPE